MSKNVIHNFDIKIQNSSKINSSEELAKTFIKELAKVSIEKKTQKDIIQLWQEQKNQNTAVALNNSNTSAKGGAANTFTGIMQNPTALAGTTPLVPEKTIQDSNTVKTIIGSNLLSTSTTAPVEGGAADNTERTLIGSSASVSNTPSIMGVENQGLTSQIYSDIASQQIVSMPKNLQVNPNEPSIEVIKTAVNNKLDIAKKENNLEAVNYWTAVLKSFDEGASAIDLDGKPGHILFTQMYSDLKQLNSTAISVQNFNWEIIREKMIKAINTSIISGSISKADKDLWEKIKKELTDDKTNIANLFEQYDELFLLLKEVEGLNILPSSITITTKTKIYPNLSADKTYPSIGTEDVYALLKKINKQEVVGSGVNKGAVKIKNTNATSFIVGESLEFFLDESLLNQNSKKKEDINWVVYKDGKILGSEFINEGTSFSYNFDKPGAYIIEAYGDKAGANIKAKANQSGFVKVNIIAQEIQILAPSGAKGEFVRPFTQEKIFKVSLKNTTVKTLNPLKLYYQIETALIGKTNVITEERELDTSGIIKLAMPDLGAYKIKVVSKDQYGLCKESKTSVIKNEVTSIGLATKETNSVFLSGIPNQTITLEAKTFKINPPTDEEKEDVRWMIYDSNNKPYIVSQNDLFTNRRDPKKSYLLKWKEFTMPIPQDQGYYTVEAFSDRQKGAKSGATFKIEVKEPEIAEAYWAWSGGSKKTSSGFSGESNYIKAFIPRYENQKVRIYFYLNNVKTSHYIDVLTNAKGEIFKEINFDASFQNAIEFQSRKTAKIGFKLLGIQNSKPYPFKSPANYESDTTLSVTTDKKIVDVYFTYGGVRVRPEDEVPFGKNGAVVTIVAKTQNMVGQEIVLTAHKVGEKPSFSGKTIVKSEGVATTSFLLKNLDKKLKIGTQIKYYAGVEGYSTKDLVDKVLVMIVGKGKANNILDENDPQLIWGSTVSKEFRVRVVQICKKIEQQKEISFSPNVLMNIMAFETNKTFSPAAGTFKNNPNDEDGGYVGLIQFGKQASIDLKVKRSELLKMTALKQLDYVEKWFLLKTKNELKSATDIYLSVNYPIKAGIGHLDHEVVYGDPNAAYRANKPFLRETDEINEKGDKTGKNGGKTYVWEVREALEENEKEGQFRKNTVLMNKSYNLIISNPKEIFNLDTSLTFCYFSAEQIKEIRKLIDKFQTNEEKIKAYRILQYFVEYNSQRDAKYKKLADTMCNVTSESMALQYLGQMNPAPDPNMKMEDFMMVMIRDILKQGDDSRFEAKIRVKIANELGIKGEYCGVGKIFDKSLHKKILEDKLNKGFGVCLSTLGHIVRVVDVNDLGIIVDDPNGQIQSFKIRKEKGNKGGYVGGKNYSDNSILKGESNLWLWQQLKEDKIVFNYYEWYYL